MSEDFAFVVTVKKRGDLEAPTNATDAASFIKWKLEEGAMLEVVSVYAATVEGASK
ncbi:hypothetical protein UFOVP658_78 [uncultured Caudovirales phage]|uniref:Uncharacterized protein n=1 Tax=uncultured Caudovirales phage TaxID=2100421 RepID=A0A6J5NI70_9CAUD|nr:hypothetical protein UFOVP658_78 [uncultured Caudovirales phage]